MKKYIGILSRIVILMLIASQVVIGLPGQASAAKEHQGHHKDHKDVENLVIYQNIPQADAQLKDEEIQLKALHVYKDGHFMWTEDLSWKSTNKKVASVSKDGTVTVTGKPGKTFIKVTDGKHSDRIAIQTKPSKDQKTATKILPNSKKTPNLVKNAIKNMTLEEKIGQMLMPDFRTWDGEDVTEMLPEIEQMVKDYHLGGVILFRENVVTTEQTTKLVDAYQHASEKYGLLVTIDQEGGIVTRLQSGTDMPGNMALGATRSEKLTYDVGHVIGEELHSLGINMNLAPVMDVNNNPDNPVIGVRSFGEDPELVGDLGVSYMKGVQDANVAATAKHFPGHGDTAVDSHIGLPEVPYDLERLEQTELYPFQQAMDAGIDAIITAHVTFPKIDDTQVTSKKTGEKINLPATLSHKVLTGLMRERMDYDGVIYTDALNMNAITEHFGSVDAAIRAVKAGTDILLMPVGVEDVAKGLKEAVQNGEIKEKRIEESVARILELKLEREIIKSEYPTPVEDKIEQAKEVVGSDQHKRVEKEAAEQSVTVLKNNDVLPIEANDVEVVVVGKSFIDSLGKAVKDKHSNTTVIALDDSYTLTDEQKQQVKDADYVVIGTYTYNVSSRSADSDQMMMVQAVQETANGSIIGVGIRNPYDIMAYPEIDAYLAQYGFRDASFKASAAILFGDLSPSGKLPVTIPEADGDEALYPYGHGLTFDSGEDNEISTEPFKLGVEQLLDEKKELIEGK